VVSASISGSAVRQDKPSGDTFSLAFTQANKPNHPFGVDKLDTILAGGKTVFVWLQTYAVHGQIW